MSNIRKEFPVTNEEYQVLDQEFGQLAEFISWDLIKKNTRNNHTDDQQDIAQELKIALCDAASYFKRQTYIEKCLELCSKHAKDKFIKAIVVELIDLWENKTRHGAKRQKFGPHQEEILKKITKKFVPKKERPSKKEPLKVDPKFTRYCKSIAWNRQHAIGRRITKERSWRSGLVSLSEFDLF